MKFKHLKLNARELAKFTRWSKEAIYESYVLTMKQLHKERAETNRLRLVIAGLELDVRRAKHDKK